MRHVKYIGPIKELRGQWACAEPHPYLSDCGLVRFDNPDTLWNGVPVGGVWHTFPLSSFGIKEFPYDDR